MLAYNISAESSKLNLDQAQSVNITSMTNTYCCEYIIKTPNDDSKSVRNM